MGSSAHVPRVYLETALAVGDQLDLSDAKRHHLGTVLRLKEGAPVTLFNGDGAEYAARITTIARRTMALTIEACHRPQRESPLAITLLQAIVRGDRMDFAIAKAVELGVTRLCPVFTARAQVKLSGERLHRKQAHWQAIAESAAEQSGRLLRPEVTPALDLPARLQWPATDGELRLLLAPGATRTLADCQQHAQVTLLVGPESGLSAAELETAASHGWTPLALGPRILRTETAGMAALTALQTCWGDLGGAANRAGPQ